MAIKVVSFDVGDTLLTDRWQYDSFACDSVENAGISIHREKAGEIYRRLFGENYAEYKKLNLEKNYELGDKWWFEITKNFLVELGENPEFAQKVVDCSHEMLYSGESRYFPAITNGFETLTRLRESGFRLGVISNWDMTLHRTLENIGYLKFFEVVISSGEVGFEKPDRRIFETFCAKMGCDFSQVAHVGDNPIADIEGATTVGMKAIYFNEKVENSFAKNWKVAHVNDLAHIPEAIKRCD